MGGPQSAKLSQIQPNVWWTFTSSPQWINGPLKEPWGPPFKHHRPRVPPVPPSSSVSIRVLSLLALNRAQSSLSLVDNRLLPRILEPHAGLMVTVGRRLFSVLVQHHNHRLLAAKHQVPLKVSQNHLLLQAGNLYLVIPDSRLPPLSRIPSSATGAGQFVLSWTDQKLQSTASASVISSSSIGFQCSSSLTTGLFSGPGRDIEPFNDYASTSGQTLASRTSVVAASGHPSCNYQPPYPTSTGLSAISAQVR